jgi:hypothetical protein
MTLASLLAVASLVVFWHLLRPARTWEVRAGGVRVRAGLTRAAAVGQVAALVGLPGVLAVDRATGDVL